MSGCIGAYEDACICVILAVTLCTAMQQQVLGYRICHYYVYVYVYVDKKVKEKRDVIIRMEVRIDRVYFFKFKLAHIRVYKHTCTHAHAYLNATMMLHSSICHT